MVCALTGMTGKDYWYPRTFPDGKIWLEGFDEDELLLPPSGTNNTLQRRDTAYLDALEEEDDGRVFDSTA